ncbi:MAG TPA: NlpC/P60 family protein [Acidimicrobiales bacterium]|nr:NlpC/P60 family protein [Acidimicrobiales bacterium]
MLQRVGVPALTVVTVLSSTVLGLARPVGGDQISDAKAKAAAIESQLSQAQNEMSALSQQYDEAQYHLSQINSSIQTTEANISSDQQQVLKDKNTLAKAAVANYITDGTASTQNSIFSGNQETLGATSEYNQIAEGDISLAVDQLHTAENQLNAQKAQLTTEQGQAQTQVNAEQAAVAQNQQAINQQKNALAQEQGQIAQLVQQQQQAEAAAAAQAARQRQAAAAAAAAAPSSGGGSSQLTSAAQAPPPPTAPGGSGAVQEAETQIGVPYQWGAESPGVGFDCSGLTAWSWGQVGVSLPHYSGGQMADSAPVPLSDLQPGDLLFYGPGGSDHVAMYVSPGTMIEAPYTGADVRLTALRLGDGFAGAGRP